MIRVLITSGGTRTAIDEVRWLGNVATGRFGSKIATAALQAGCEVTLLHAEGAIVPHQRIIEVSAETVENLRPQIRQIMWANETRERYHSCSFVDYFDYARQLESLLRDGSFDMVFLSAAVSDYVAEPQTGKLRSDAEELTIRLKRVPKLIAQVKDWAPNIYLVGFKLLAGATEEELIAAAQSAGRANRADVTVANDIRSIRENQHVIHLVREGEPVETYRGATEPAGKLVERTLQWFKERSPEPHWGE